MPRTLSFEGYRFWPISAAVCFCGTLSVVATILTGDSLIPAFLWQATYVVMGIFYLAALFSGLLGFLSLILCGVTEAGCLRFFGIELSGGRLGLLLVFCYLLPWGCFALASWSSGYIR